MYYKFSKIIGAEKRHQKNEREVVLLNKKSSEPGIHLTNNRLIHTVIN